MTMLFDFGGLTAEEQARVRQAAATYIQTKMGADDLVSIFVPQNGAVSVITDFTADRDALLATIRGLGDAGSSDKTSSLLAAAKVLGRLQQKTALIYYSNGLEQSSEIQDVLQKTLGAALQSRLSIYAVDVRGLSAAAPAPQDEQSRRVAEAQQRFGSASNAMARAWIRYGPPDQIDTSSNRVVWRYHYLENFHNSAEFEFTQVDRFPRMRINWPPPVATFPGAPAVDQALVQALASGAQAASAVQGLPGRHASMQTYPAGESQVLSIPLDSLTGKVDIVSQVRIVHSDGRMQNVANARDVVQAPDAFQASFNLVAGSYLCTFVVREQATGQTYGESILFDVK